MEINTKGKRETVTNPEGSTVLKRDSEIQLYLEASSLNLKEDKFYEKADDKLLTFLDHAYKEDKEFVRGLANFLTDNGIKLAPVVLYSSLATRGYSFAKVPNVNSTFNTPQRIAEAIALANGKQVHLNNSYKLALKRALENMSSYTLRKNKLSGRKVKTKDLIKLLRPHPANDEMSALYKALIEDSKLSKMGETESFVRVKSSTTMKEEDKKDYLINNIDKIPLNELVRNLRYVSDKYDYTTMHSLIDKVIKRFSNLSRQNMRFLNLFDLVEVAIAVPALEKAMLMVIDSYCASLRKELDMDFGKATILFDVSGSMASEGIEKGLRYAAVLSRLYSSTTIRLFADRLFSQDKDLARIFSEWHLNKVSEALHSTPSRGTALIESIEALYKEKKDIGTLIVISDECTWKEGSYLVSRISTLKKTLSENKLVVINPIVYEGTVFDTNVVAISSLTSKILLDLAILQDKAKFIKYVKDYGRDKQ